MGELERVRYQIGIMDKPAVNAEESHYGFGFGALAGFTLAASIGWAAIKRASQVTTRRRSVAMQMSESTAEIEAPPSEKSPALQPPPAPPTLQAPPSVATAAPGEATQVPLTKALPKIKTMMVGDGTLAGDMNFDPLGFSETPEDLAW